MRHPFLALLAQAPAHGYELRQALEQRFGDLLPPMNAGQIYTTLGRLQRDGLVSSSEVAQDDRPNKRVYALTEEGRAALEAWLAAPAPSRLVRDDFPLKLVLAGVAGLADPQGLIDRQRAECLRALRSLDELAAQHEGEVAELLVEGALLHVQADLRWLDLCEERLTSP